MHPGGGLFTVASGSRSTNLYHARRRNFSSSADLFRGRTMLELGKCKLGPSSGVLALRCSWKTLPFRHNFLGRSLLGLFFLEGGDRELRTWRVPMAEGADTNAVKLYYCSWEPKTEYTLPTDMSSTISSRMVFSLAVVSALASFCSWTSNIQETSKSIFHW